MNGGYQIIDVNGLTVSMSTRIPGLYNTIEENYTSKPMLVKGAMSQTGEDTFTPIMPQFKVPVKSGMLFYFKLDSQSGQFTLSIDDTDNCTLTTD